MDWINLIQVLGSILAGLGLGMFTRSGRLKAKAEAQDAMAKMYESRIADLHRNLETCNETEAKHLERISELNRALDDKTDRIRKVSDDLYAIQKELNEAKERMIDLTEQRDKERECKEYYRRWRCEKSSCLDPEGRIPPNTKLKSEEYKSPE